MKFFIGIVLHLNPWKVSRYKELLIPNVRIKKNKTHRVKEILWVFSWRNFRKFNYLKLSILGGIENL